MTSGQTPPPSLPLGTSGLTASRLPDFQGGERIRIVPGGLATRLDKTAIGSDQAQAMTNCNVDTGVWKLDKRYRQCQPAPNGSNTVRGFGYGMSYANGDYYVMVQGASAYDLKAGWVDSADSLWGGSFNGATSHWDAAIQPSLELEDWYIWEHQGKMFFASGTSGYVRYKDIGDGPMEKLYQRYELDINDGIATERPPYPKRAWDAGDTFSQPSHPPDGAWNAWATATVSNGHLFLDVESWNLWTSFHFRATLASNLNLTGIHYIGMKFSCPSWGGGQWFDFIHPQAGTQGRGCLKLFNATSSVTSTISGATRIMFRNKISAGSPGLSEAWVMWDISQISDANKNDIDWVEVHFEHQGGNINHTIEVSEIFYGGTFFHDYVAAGGGIIGQLPQLQPDVEYAYTYDGTGTGGSGTPESGATKLVMNGRTAFGEELTPPFSGSSVISNTNFMRRMFMGSRIKLDIAPQGSPYTSADKINVYRKVFTAVGVTRWQRLTQLDNTGTPTYTDQLPDSTLIADTTTYPIKTGLTFSGFVSNLSGPPPAIICGCSWRGSNVYFGSNGRAYFSQQGDFKRVLWDGVAISVDPDDPSRPRTLTVSDQTDDPVICPVSNNALYMFTRRAVYAMTGENPSEAEAPRKMPSLQGVLGKRAAHAYRGGAVYASDTGLYYIEVGSVYTGKPGEAVVEELTREVTGTWAQLIGSADDRTQTVVCCYDNEIYVFCKNRYMRFTKAGRWVYGEYQTGHNVYAAIADPRRGVVLALTNGKLANVGEFPTDLGTNAAGDNGTAPSWTYYTKRFVSPISLQRAIAYYTATSGTPSLTIKGYTSRNTNPAALTFTTKKRLPFENHVGKETNGDWFELYISGDNKTVLHSLELEIGAYQEGGDA